VVFLAVFLLASFNLVITAFTISLNTGGILWITVLAFLTSHVVRKRERGSFTKRGVLLRIPPREV
jgi:hypothetical protein